MKWLAVIVLGIALGLSPWGNAPVGAAADPSASPVVEIKATADETGRLVYFEPIGILVEPGTTVRWVLERNYHSVAAYHPENGNRELRIPEGAEPWDSGMLLVPGTSTFEVTLTVPGVYDYYCLPHERAGMVGRIIVGEPSGPGAEPFGYGAEHGWLAVPEAAQRAFPSIEEIMAKGVAPAVRR